jgi:hypothetical protein
MLRLVNGEVVDDGDERMRETPGDCGVWLDAGVQLASSLLFYCESGSVTGQQRIGEWFRAHSGGAVGVVATLASMAARMFERVFGTEAVDFARAYSDSGLEELADADPADRWCEGYYCAAPVVLHSVRGDITAAETVMSGMTESAETAWGLAVGLADAISWAARAGRFT